MEACIFFSLLAIISGYIVLKIYNNLKGKSTVINSKFLVLDLEKDYYLNNCSCGARQCNIKFFAVYYHGNIFDKKRYIREQSFFFDVSHDVKDSNILYFDDYNKGKICF